MSLGEQIKKYRLALELKLEHLAELTEVSPGTISALTVRSSDRSKYAAPLAKGLGLSLEELLDPNANYLAKCFDHIDHQRPHGWSPTQKLLSQVAAARLSTAAKEPNSWGAKDNASEPKEVIWPFSIVTYDRIDKIRRHFSAHGMPSAISEIDLHLDILVTRWENEMHQAKRPAA